MTVTADDIKKFLDNTKSSGDLTKIVKKPIQLKIDNEDENVLMWVSSKNTPVARSIKKGVVICEEFDSGILEDTTYIFVDNPRMAFQKVLTKFFLKAAPKGISESALLHPSSLIGDNVYIGHNVVIEEDCIIENNVVIDHNTVIKHGTKIGENVKIGSNCVIAGVGFGYEKNEEGHYMFIPHLGNVEIGNYVEIGNNTCIDRAVLGSTFIGDYSKIDNLVHIAHGVQIGRNSLVIANAMVAGSVSIGENSWIAPSSSIMNQKKIGNNVTVGLSAVVTKDVDDGKTVIGSPAEEISEVISNKKKLSHLLNSLQQ